MKKIISCVAAVLVIVIIAVLMIGRTKAVIPTDGSAEISAVLYSSETGLAELHPDEAQKQEILDLLKPFKATGISGARGGSGNFLTINVFIHVKDEVDLRTINISHNSERENTVAIGDKLYKIKNSETLYNELLSILGL